MKTYAAIDTETINGYARLMAIYGEKGHRVVKITGIAGFRTIAESLIDYGKYYIAYNLDYDATAILKYLPEPLLHKLSYMSIEYNNYRIKYVRNKYLRITTGKKSIEIYDIMQYFGCSLNTAAQKYLNLEKYDVDAANITNENIYTDEIINYCIRDAELTYRLGLFFVSTLPVELQNVKLISNAYLSKQYFKHELKHEIPYGYNLVARKAFRGGRFEVIRKGYFQNVYYYDINSAYPDAMLKLQGVSDVVVDDKKDPSAAYTIILCDVDLPGTEYSPLLIERYGMLFCPVGRLRHVWITGIEYDDLQMQNAMIKIKRAYNYYGNGEYPYREKVLKLYEYKKQYYAYKIILNSLYGKMCQSIDKYTCKPGNGTVQEAIILDDNVYRKYEDLRGSNFIHAAYITAYTRSRLYNIIRNNYDKIIAVFTDCVISTAPIEDLALGDAIGLWKQERYDELWMIGSGVYFKRQGDKITGRIRGFRTVEKDAEVILQHILNSKSDVVELPVRCRISLVEALSYEYIDFANIIFDELKYLNLNFDKKRIWLDNFRCGKDIANKQIQSWAPIILDSNKPITL